MVLYVFQEVRKQLSTLSQAINFNSILFLKKPLNDKMTHP